MNFLNAIRHAAIGYGIRRKPWPENSILSLDNACVLRWLHKINVRDDECKLLGPDTTLDLQAWDIVACDWDTV